MIRFEPWKRSTRGARGSNAQDGDVDVMVQISGDGIKVATVTKANDQAEDVLTHFKAERVVLGTDEEGADIATVIISADDCGLKDGKAKRADLNRSERRAMEMLVRAVLDVGQDPPPGEFPRKIKVVPLDTWRTNCERGGLSSGESAEAFPKAFKRARDGLVDKHRIGIWDGLVWIAYDET